ncbi:MAG: hypothetical protein HY700_09870 [Gemmatimonadetes bacterium]|nr:hypothetical protein [Gemmatimonadota bacterium]
MTSRGITLLIVLWVLVAVGAASALAFRFASNVQLTSRYRTSIAVARWVAEGCLNLARARAERWVRDGDTASWSDPERLPTRIGTVTLSPGIACAIEIPSDSGPGPLRVIGIGMVAGRRLPAMAERWVRGGYRVAVVGREIF